MERNERRDRKHNHLRPLLWPCTVAVVSILVLEVGPHSKFESIHRGLLPVKRSRQPRWGVFNVVSSKYASDHAFVGKAVVGLKQYSAIASLAKKKGVRTTWMHFNKPFKVVALIITVHSLEIRSFSARSMRPVDVNVCLHPSSEGLLDCKKPYDSST